MDGASGQDHPPLSQVCRGRRGDMRECAQTRGFIANPTTRSSCPRGP
ncbi:hypothetical protein HMPREF1980_01499 [Actinomyces sp. oral taxon 172 str. F0311]|nr:hypothetical protein HMPREF1980_01499 [Actinomyces sp. oral taxon 172 str. F0311]